MKTMGSITLQSQCIIATKNFCEVKNKANINYDPNVLVQFSVCSAARVYLGG